MSALREATRGEALDEPDDLEVVAHHLGVEWRDERAEMRLDPDQPVAFHDLECFTHREPAHADLRGDLVLRNSVARAEITGEDHLAQMLGDMIAREAAHEAPIASR